MPTIERRRYAKPLQERRPRDIIQTELVVAEQRAEALRRELNEYSCCACGSIPLLFGQEILEDGSIHGRNICGPPHAESSRCQCGYAMLRPDRETWTCATYSSEDDERKPLMHTRERCYEYGD